MARIDESLFGDTLISGAVLRLWRPAGGRGGKPAALIAHAEDARRRTGVSAWFAHRDASEVAPAA